MNMQKLFVAAGILLYIIFLAASASAHHPSGGAGLVQTGPINTTPASTLQKGLFSFGLQTEYIKLKAFSEARLMRYAELGNDVHSADSVHHHSLSIAYGLTDNLTIGLKIPYVQINNITEAHSDEPDEVHKHGDSRGPGDITLLGHYRFLKHDNGFEGAVTIGLKVPTGRTNDRDREGETFEAEFLPGTGAWHPIIGISATQRLGRFSIDASLHYTVSTEGTQRTDIGDLLNYNAALSYRPLSRDISLDLVLELNGEWKEKQKVNGEKDKDSGGNIVYLSPGTRVNFGQKLSVYLSFGFPVVQDLNGTQNKVDYKAVFGLGMQM